MDNKDFDLIIKQCIEEMEEFEKTGITKKEIVKIELDGKDAIMFRAIIGLVDEGKKVNAINDAFTLGISEMGKTMCTKLREITTIKRGL